MKILYLETSSKNCSVAISDDEKLLSLCEETSENYKQSESLHSFVEWALEGAELSLKDIEAVCLGKGPVLIPVCELEQLLLKDFVSV